MGWVVDEAVIRLRGELGQYRRHEWRDLLHDCNLSWSFETLPESFDAVLLMRFRHVMFRNGLSDDAIAKAAFHEVGHTLLHAGSRDFWKNALPGLQGGISVDKWERQAEAFVEAFPVWEE